MLEPRTHEDPPCAGWSVPEALADTLTVGAATLGRAALQSRGAGGAEATGSAAAVGEPPIQRARSELLERIATLEAIGAQEPFRAFTPEGKPDGFVQPEDVFASSNAPARWRYARSDGVAVHTSWARACERAWWERIERDRVLRAWAGGIRPRAAPVPPLLSSVAPSGYRFRAALLREPDRARRVGRDVDAAVVIGFPLRRAVPLVRGFAARPDAAEALQQAAHESLQQLAFLWEEPIPHRAPEPSPTPMFHLEHFLYPDHHQVLESWLDGAHTPSKDVVDSTYDGDFLPRFVDLTPVSLKSRLRVARVVWPGSRPLRFGAPAPGQTRGPHPIA